MRYRRSRRAAPHPIIGAPKRAKSQCRTDDAVLAQPPKDNQAVEAGQHAIDGHDRVFVGTAAAQPVVAIDREIHLIAAVRKRIHELFRGSRDRLRGPECGAVLRPCFSSSNPTSMSRPKCKHKAFIEVDQWPDDMSVALFGSIMECSKCGTAGADVRPAWKKRAR
jgi:hypothetical protein